MKPWNLPDAPFDVLKAIAAGRLQQDGFSRDEARRFIITAGDQISELAHALDAYPTLGAFVCWGIDPDGIDIWNAGGPGVTAFQARAANYSASHSKVVTLDLGECAKIVHTKAGEHNIDFPGFIPAAEKLH